MRVHGIKTKKRKINPNLSMWKASKNKDVKQKLKSINIYKEELKQKHIMQGNEKQNQKN